MRYLFLLLAGVFALVSCENEKPRLVNPPSVIQSTSLSYIRQPVGGQAIRAGDSLRIEVALRETPSEFESVRILVDGNLVFTATEQQDSYSFLWQDLQAKMGTHTIRAEVKVNGKTEQQHSSFIVIAAQAPARYSYQVVSRIPHDRQAYTQGLVIENGILYEGTGLEGKSELRMLNLFNGQVIRKIALENRYFGEGVTILDDKIYQLTYRSNKGFVYQKDKFEKIAEFTYPTEGWGITHNGKELIMSDGTHRLFFIDPQTFRFTDTLEVYDHRGTVSLLNELEYINGEIWANLYQSDYIARIDPGSGKLNGLVDMRGLLNPSDRHPTIDVLNGIAWDEKTKRLFVTGKNWPWLYQISVTEQSSLTP